MPRPAADSDSVKSRNLFGPGANLGLELNARIEPGFKRDRNLRCTSTQLLSQLSECNSRFIPTTSFQFSLKSVGTVADRFHVDIDYDKQREFDASNVLSLYYQGDSSERIRRVEVGNVSFAAPASRFITSSVPSGNYGLQSVVQLGRMRLQGIVAKQSGNVVQRREFIVGSRTTQPGEQVIEDFQIERLRFFFTIDPALLRGYPNIDILDGAQLASARAALPDTLRPSRVYLYRLQFGTQPQNPNGPRFRVRGDPAEGRQTYDLLREGVDYFMDRSLLWFALVRPLNQTNERLVVAFTVRVNGRDTVWVSTGGTPDIRAAAGVQVANLVADPSVGPTSPAFRREIRSVYRIGGEDLIRESVDLRVVTGSGNQEHPLAGSSPTFLHLFGLAQPTNAGRFDVEQRLWPRRSDPVFNLSAGAVDVRSGENAFTDPLSALQIIRDYFLIFPSLRPFAARDSGLVTPGNPSNDSIYTIPGEYLYSQQRPASVYRMNVRYQTSGMDPVGALTLGSVQLRRGSERITIDGRPLLRDADYLVDYDIGRVTFARPDTLFPQPRRVEVRYEENPTGLEPASTTLAGVLSSLPVSHGQLNFTMLQQRQSSIFTRPQLGFQGTSSLMTGVSGDFAWTVPMLDRMFCRPERSGGPAVPAPGTQGDQSAGAQDGRRCTRASRLSIQGEIAASRPQLGLGDQAQAYVESFETEGGLSIPLADQSWYYSSLPAYGRSLRLFGPGFFEPARAATLTWQTNAAAPVGTRTRFTLSDIDPLVKTTGTGLAFIEPMLWLTLQPLNIGGRYNLTTKQFDWTIDNAPTGRRFRSIRTVLNPGGVDLSHGEFLEFWTLIDTLPASRAKNPTLVFDFGDVSENSLTFGPDTLIVRRNANGNVDSLFAGKRLQGFDRLDTERDSLSRAFNVDTNDVGLPGDRLESLLAIDGATVSRLTNFKLCQGALNSVNTLGDPRTNCTVRNSRLDEEDIDQDNAMNFPSGLRESERLLRYVVDLANPARYTRVGSAFTDTVAVNGFPTVRTRHWVLVRVPFTAANDTLNGVEPRRIKALRLTIVSGTGADDREAAQLPIARLRVAGAPWLKRSDATIPGLASQRPGGGFVAVSTIGTTDSTSTLVYQPPPGVINEAETRTGQFQAGLTQINERSMRILAVNMPLNHRAETYYRFPAGPQYFMAYKELRLWARGRNNGWGPNGELEMFVKMGRDENNFYLYRTSVNAGTTQAAWEPEVRVDFERFYELRKRVQNAYLSGKTESIDCTGVDSALVVSSPTPIGIRASRFAACEDGYVVYTVDPAVSAPNLAAVQELSIGFLRVAQSGGAVGASTILPGDTLELWIDDIRLARPVTTTGYAGQIGLALAAGDVADIRLNLSNRDPNFRQIGEQPTYLSERNIDIVSTVRLDKLLGSTSGWAMPLTITKLSVANDALFLTRTDIGGRGVAGLRKPRNDYTSYTLTVRRTAPLTESAFAPLVNNLALTSSYVSGVNQNEYQTGRARSLTVGLDYVITEDTARTASLPWWLNRALGLIPDVLEHGPIRALRTSVFRWNPTQLRLSSGLVRGSDRRASFLTPSSAAGSVFGDGSRVTDAVNRLWRSGSVLELHPTNGLTARWEIESARDLRDYGDSTMTAVVTSNQRRRFFGANAGFERERTMITSFSIAPVFSPWLKPRLDLGTQYSMLRDPNVRSLVPRPGVIVVDSLLAARDSMSTAGSFTLPRRMTAAQTASAGMTIDLGQAIASRTRDSTLMRRIGSIFAPVDVSYTRSLVSALDAAAVHPPLFFQLGLGGPSSFRVVNGVDASTAGYTGTGSIAGSLQFPAGTSLINRYRRTTTRNWMRRFDEGSAQVDGDMTVFPDASFQWSYRPTWFGGFVSNVAANVGFARTTATISLPSLLDDSPPQFRRTHMETFPMRASVVWARAGDLTTTARYSLTRRRDSLPGSASRSRGDDIGVDVGRAFHVPASWGLGLQSPLRARLAVQQSHSQTFILDSAGGIASRLQDNGRQAFSLSADADVAEGVVFTLQGSQLVTFDHNLNRRLAQTAFSTVLQFRFFGGEKQ